MIDQTDQIVEHGMGMGMGMGMIPAFVGKVGT